MPNHCNLAEQSSNTSQTLTIQPLAQAYQEEGLPALAALSPGCRGYAPCRVVQARGHGAHGMNSCTESAYRVCGARFALAVRSFAAALVAGPRRAREDDVSVRNEAGCRDELVYVAFLKPVRMLDQTSIQ
jgi:hypothetical protein